MIYDLLIVGAGISAATISAILGKKRKICVIDTEDHIGGKCFDYRENGVYIHKYGPHIFHTNNKKVLDLLKNYTTFIPYEHHVLAEIKVKDKILQVPFPYSEETEKVVKLSEEEIIEYFFRGYSEKMWGIEWNNLPPEITKRIPKHDLLTSNYFPNEFSALPQDGYTNMLEKMFSDVDVVLNADEDEWHSIAAEKIIYCGRIDRILLNEEERVQDLYHELPYRAMKISHKNKEIPSIVLNICHLEDKAIRYIDYGKLNSKESSCVFAEYAIKAKKDDISPSYPIPFNENKALYMKCDRIVHEEFDNLITLGRLGNYLYIDMDEAVERAIKLCEKL